VRGFWVILALMGMVVSAIVTWWFYRHSEEESAEDRADW